MKKSSLIVILFVLLIQNVSVAQCYIKSTDQSGGNVTYYIDPELVAQTESIGIAISVQMVGGSYYLAVMYQFVDKAQPLEEKVAIELQNGYTLELDMYTMQGGDAGGVAITAAVFNMNDEQIDFFTKSELKAIHFKTQAGVKHDVMVTSNNKMLIRQLKCFGKS